MRGNDISVEQMRGRQVFDKAGNELGNVEDMTFNPDGLRVTGFVVKVSKDAADRLHLDRPVLGSARINVGADRLRSIGDSVLLNIEQREMADMLYDPAHRGSHE